MRTVQTFRGKVLHGQVLPYDQDGWGRLVEALEGQDIEVRLGKRREKRSLSQNNYYHGVVVPHLAEHCGYEHDEMHEVLKWRFLKRVDDNGIETARSTTELTTAEMAEFTEQCRRLAAQLGVVIPDPGMME